MWERLDKGIGRGVGIVAGGYLLFGLLWILLSDRVVDLVSSTRAEAALLQTYKGLAFVVLSTALIALLLAREMHRRRSTDRYWRDVIDLADEGFWLIDAAGCTRSVNQRMASLLGCEPTDMIGRAPFDFVVDEDHDVFEHQIGRGSRQGLRHVQTSHREYEVRLRHRRGQAVPFLVHATSLHDPDDRFLGSYAFMTDLTEIHANQRALDLSRYAIDHSFDEIYRIDPGGRIVDANEAACRNLGYGRETLLQCTVSDVAPLYPPDAWEEHWRDLDRQPAIKLETRHRTRDGVDYPVEVVVSKLEYEGETFAYAIARDIRVRKAAEASAERARDTLLALSRANSALIHSTDRETLLQRVCESLTDSRGYPLVWIGLVRDDAETAVEVSAAAGDSRDYLEDQLNDAGRLPVASAIRSGENCLLRGGDADADYRAWQASAGPHGFRSTVSLPIRVEERVVGALNVYSVEADAFDAQELPLLEELADDLGFGMHMLRIRAERDRQLSRLRLAGAVFDNTAEGIIVTDAKVRIQMVNPAFTRITGYELDETRGHTPKFLQSGLQGQDFYDSLWSELHSRGQWQGEIWNRRRDGEVFPEWLTINEVRDETGTLVNYVGIFADITEAHQTREELVYRTYHDALTGLANRALYREKLAEVLEDSRASPAVVLIDLQGFRALNDSFGADGGDRILRQVAARLQEVLADDGLVARPGGDEFWLLLWQVSQGNSIDDWLASIARRLSEPMTVAEHTVRLELGMGVALAPGDGQTVDRLLANAATALHRAQEEGRGRVQFFQQAMQEAVQHRVRIEEALKVVLDQDELHVWYQPQIMLANGKAAGAEALIRWQHPEWGWVSPGEFIPVAEATGLVVPIGDWVLEQALQQMARWRSAGLPIDRISVNAAAAQLQRNEWAERVAAMLADTGVPAHCLEIEITEQGVLKDLDTALTTMHALKSLDVRLAIDDFGTGYSSLAYLQRLPLDTLKIDKAFVDGLPDVAYSLSIVEAILAVSRTLGFEVVAEGVETQTQADWLREHDVQWAQGFLFGRAEPAEDMEGRFSG